MPWYFKLALVACISALLLSACGGRGPTPTPEPSLAAQSSPAPSNTPEEVATPSLESELPTMETDLLPTGEIGDLLPTEEGSELFPTEEDGDLLPTGENGDIFTGEETEDLSGLGEDTGEFSGTEEPLQFQPTPADIPLGQPGNPLVLGVVTNSGQNPELLDNSLILASQLSELTGYSIDAMEVNTTTDLLNGMQVGAIHMAWLQPFTYILASRRDYAQVALVTKHFGVYAYGMQFLANANSELTSYFDTNTNQNTADATEALAQFADLRPCWVDELSASGYVAPAGYLAINQVTTQSPLFMQSHTAVIRALYVGGICDFGATYAVYGDPRTAETLQQDIPDVLQKVMIVWQSGEIIPNLNFSFQSEVPAEMVEKITTTLMDYVLDQNGLDVVNAATGYEIDDFQQVDDSFYNPLRELLQYSRVNLRTLVGK